MKKRFLKIRLTQYKERLERLEKEAILEMTKDNGTASAETREKPQQEQSHMLVKMLDKANTTKSICKSQYNKGQYGEIETIQ